MFFFVLTENFDTLDELVMKAKINFFAAKVGNNPNIVEFIGSVTDSPSCKFITIILRVIN